MATISVNNISKRFGEVQALDNVSFEINPGEIFGLLGPNGAGKTTMIRIILDIYKADQGTASILGGPMTEAKKNQIGYLPEERGLYQDIQLDRCLHFLASLKGMEPMLANRKITEYLERFDLASDSKKKVKELSKGMQQKAQLISALVHNPEVLIIDEPFSALDPVNTQMVKDLLIEERNIGKTIVMCTHQMAQVEQLCDRLVLIDHGQLVLEGSLADIRKKFASNDVIIRTESSIPGDLMGIESIVRSNNHVKLHLSENSSPQQVLAQLVQQGIILDEFEIATPSLDEIFIQVVSRGKVRNE